MPDQWECGGLLRQGHCNGSIATNDVVMEMYFVHFVDEFSQSRALPITCPPQHVPPHRTTPGMCPRCHMSPPLHDPPVMCPSPSQFSPIMCLPRHVLHLCAPLLLDTVANSDQVQAMRIALLSGNRQHSDASCIEGVDASGMPMIGGPENTSNQEFYYSNDRPFTHPPIGMPEGPVSRCLSRGQL